MIYVALHFAWWIFLAALGLGILVGISTWAQKPRGSWMSGWLNLAAIALVIGVLAAIFKLLPGRPGVWLESGLMMFAAYMVGCVLGSWLRGLFAAPVPALGGALAGAAGSLASLRGAGQGASIAPVATFPPAPANAPLAIDSSSAYPGKRPPGLASVQGAPDDLTVIEGIGAADQRILNDLGIHHIRQVAGWNGDHARWIEHHLAQPGRVEGEDWPGKAAALAGSPAAAAGATVFMPRTPSTADAPAQQEAAAARSPSGGETVVFPGKGAAAAKAATEGQTAAGSTAASDAAHPGIRPQGLAEAIGGRPDNLKLVSGIGPQNEKKLNGLGIWHFSQIAAWSAEEVEWAGSFLAFPGRIERERWVEQARLLASGGTTDFSRRAASGAVYGDGGDQPHAGDMFAAHPGIRPQGLAEAIGGRPDNLKLVSGIGPQNEKKLNGLGIWHFSQIAAWSAEEVEWAGSFLAFPGRIERERWVEQAQLLASGGTTDFSRRAASGAVYGDVGDQPHAGDMFAAHPGKRPGGIAVARGGKADNLKRIAGIGRRNEQLLNAIGIWHYDQIAAWTREEIEWTGSFLAFHGRIEREDWTAQARQLAQGIDTDFARRVDAGDVETSSDSRSDR